MVSLTANIVFAFWCIMASVGTSVSVVSYRFDDCARRQLTVYMLVVAVYSILAIIITGFVTNGCDIMAGNGCVVASPWIIMMIIHGGIAGFYVLSANSSTCLDRAMGLSVILVMGIGTVWAVSMTIIKLAESVTIAPKNSSGYRVEEL